MEIYRLVRSIYKEDFSSEGAYLYGGRWNSRGLHALYASGHISLAVVEIMVNLETPMLRSLKPYHLLRISLPEDLVLSVQYTDLKVDWIRDREYTRFIGDEFLRSQSGPVLKIPSAVVPEESNYLINPRHADFEKLEVELPSSPATSFRHSAWNR